MRYETSQDEVFVGLSSVAVPLAAGTGSPASLAVIYLNHDVDVAEIAGALEEAARRVEQALR